MSLRTDGFEPVLAALSQGAQQYFGDAAAVVEPVSRMERPFSALLRLRVRTADRDSHAFAKVFKPRLSTPEELAQLRRYVEREFCAAKCLYEALGPQPGLSALRPVAVFPDDLAIVTEEVVGTTFERTLRDALWGRRVAIPIDVVAERIGAWIRTYQTVIDADGVLDLSERREYLDVRLRRLMAAGVMTDADAALALERYDALASRVAPQPLVAIHADLNPGNILVTADGGVTILDFSMAKTGARFHDLTHLYMHLEFLRWRPRLKSAVVDDAQSALIRGYDSSCSSLDPLFQLMLLQHLVCHVALLTERPSGPLDPAFRWFVRRRWAKCARVHGLGTREKPSRRSAFPLL
jgi:Phosphotransferase enzyme family